MTQVHPYSPILNHDNLNQGAGNLDRRAAGRVSIQDPLDRDHLKIRQRVLAVMMSRSLDTTKALRGRRETPLQRALQEPQAALRQQSVRLHLM